MIALAIVPVAWLVWRLRRVANGTTPSILQGLAGDADRTVVVVACSRRVANEVGLKANPETSRGIAHDFYCTHNPCRCGEATP
jgi:hypothetical protein